MARVEPEPGLARASRSPCGRGRTAPTVLPPRTRQLLLLALAATAAVLPGARAAELVHCTPLSSWSVAKTLSVDGPYALAGGASIGSAYGPSVDSLEGTHVWYLDTTNPAGQQSTAVTAPATGSVETGSMCIGVTPKEDPDLLAYIFDVVPSDSTVMLCNNGCGARARACAAARAPPEPGRAAPRRAARLIGSCSRARARGHGAPRA